MIPERNSLVEKIQSQKGSSGKPVFTPSYSFLIYVIHTYILPLRGSDNCNKQENRKLEMGCIHSLLYNRNSVVAVFYGISDGRLFIGRKYQLFNLIPK